MVFVSPTKNMKPTRLEFPMSLPLFCVEAEELLEILKTYNDEDIMQIMKVNAKLALENQQRYQHIKFDLGGSHALSSYDGLTFKYMDLAAWKQEDYVYASKHLRIISAFYGVVKPFDSIYPYRLEMQAKGMSEQIDNLYSYWSDALMRKLREDNEDGIYINLASKEYSAAIGPYVNKDEQIINIHFQVNKQGKLKTLATAAKMARGAMVKFCMCKQIKDPQALKTFDEDGWSYIDALSDENNYVFVKET